VPSRAETGKRNRERIRLWTSRLAYIKACLPPTFLKLLLSNEKKMTGKALNEKGDSLMDKPRTSLYISIRERSREEEKISLETQKKGGKEGREK